MQLKTYCQPKQKPVLGETCRNEQLLIPTEKEYDRTMVIGRSSAAAPDAILWTRMRAANHVAWTAVYAKYDSDVWRQITVTELSATCQRFPQTSEKSRKVTI